MASFHWTDGRQWPGRPVLWCSCLYVWCPSSLQLHFLFHRQGMEKSGVSGLPKPFFLCWFGWVGHFSLQQWKLCRMLCWEIDLCSWSQEANGWRSTELLASFASSWQSLSSMRTRFGSQTSFSNVDSYTHKVFYWCLEWIRYCCLVLIHYCANANVWLTFQMTREGSRDSSDIFHNVIILNNLQFYHRKVLSYIPSPICVSFSISHFHDTHYCLVQVLIILWFWLSLERDRTFPLGLP